MKHLYVVVFVLLVCSWFSGSWAVADEPPEVQRTPEVEKQLQETIDLNARACRLWKVGRYREAIPLVEKSLQIQRDILGKEHSYYAVCLNNLAMLYYQVADYGKAELLYLQALEIRKKVLGEEHPDYAMNLNYLAVLYWAMGKYGKAELFTLQAMEIQKKILGEKHPDYATSLNHLAGLYSEMGEYGKAEPLFRQALEIRKEVLGENHPDYATNLDDLAGWYSEMDEYGKAEPLFLQAMEIRKKVLGEDHLDYARSLDGLATLYRDMAEYDKAEPLYLQAMEIRKKALGEDYPVYAKSLNNLAVLYWAMGDYGKAELLYLQALEIQKRVLGEKHPDYGRSLYNLAVLYGGIGEYGKAELLTLQAMVIQKNALGEEHPDYAKSLNHLASLYRDMAQYSKAEPLYLQALEIQKKVLGEKHPDYTASLNGLAWLYRVMGEYSKAELYYLQALEIRKKVLGDEYPGEAGNRNDLAVLYENMGDYGKAEPLFQQAMESCKKAWGEEHPNYATSLNNLGCLHYYMGEYDKAEPLLRESLQRNIDFVNRIVPTQSEARATVFVEERFPRADAFLATIRRQKAVNPADAYQAVWQTRALVTRMLAQRRELIADSPETRELLDQLQITSQQLAQLTLAVPAPDQREARQKRLAELNDEKEKLEIELGRLSTEFRRQRELREAEIGDLVALLDEKTAVVDIIDTYLWDPPEKGKKLTGQWYYEAFVLRKSAVEPGYTVAWIHLGLAEPIDDAIGRWRAELTGQDSGLPPASTPPDQFLRQTIWEKIEPYLDGCSTVVILPDAQLNFLPWSALPGQRPGSYLIEDYAIATASYGQQLYGILTDPYPTASDGLLLVGGVAYDQQPGPLPVEPTKLASADRGTLSRSRAPAVNGPLRWDPLPGTEAEVDAVGGLWKGSSTPVVLKDIQANEDRLRQTMPSNRYILLSTHGFFADEKFRSWAGHDTEGEQLFEVEGFELVSAHSRMNSVTGRNPLLLSGIVVAGANLPPVTDSLGLPTGEDGILTAEEIAALDLRGTDLVVLSACQTGLGRVGGGEGVMGLGRAFHIAGAHTVVASLWRVDDEATRELMTRFYYNLWEKKMGKLEALRQAQLSMMHGVSTSEAMRSHPVIDRPESLPKTPTERRADPSLWAGFVLSGDWK